MICKHCGQAIQRAKDWGLWSDYTEGRWVVCNPKWAEEGVHGTYHEPLALSDDDIIAGLRLIVEDLR